MEYRLNALGRASSAVLLSIGLAALTSSAAEKFTTQQIRELRTNALEMMGIIPEKMPGSENDTKERIELGKKLYFDNILSMNQSQSCNTCHRVDDGLPGVDGEPTSGGAFGKRGDRNSPTTWNAGFHMAQFWDGRAADLKEQAKGPVLNPVEMAMPDEVTVIKRMNEHREYPKLFKKAFPKDSSPINYENMAEAIAAFERTLITRDRFDDFLKGDDKALTMAELRGAKTFLDNACTTCHNGPMLGANSYQKIGLVNPFPTKDPGRRIVTKDESDEFKFKVPSLRNVALTGPYFHNGTVRSLEETVKKMGYHQLGKELTEQEISDISAFLRALSGKNLKSVKPQVTQSAKSTTAVIATR